MFKIVNFRNEVGTKVLKQEIDNGIKCQSRDFHLEAFYNTIIHLLFHSTSFLKSIY